MANYTDDNTNNKVMWLIVRTTRQNIQQRDVANYTDDNTYNKEMWLIVRASRQDIQQRDVANYTDDKTRYTTKECG